jgi:hypothetical protein
MKLLKISNKTAKLLARLKKRNDEILIEYEMLEARGLNTDKLRNECNMIEEHIQLILFDDLYKQL